MSIFVDTNFLVAMYDASDQYHDQSENILRSLTSDISRLVTTDYVYDETMTFLLKTHPEHGYHRALSFDADITKQTIFHMLSISETLFLSAQEVFRKFNRDKYWSFTDCTSYAVMEDFGMQKVLTFDHHFSEMGFEIIR